MKIVKSTIVAIIIMGVSLSISAPSWAAWPFTGVQTSKQKKRFEEMIRAESDAELAYSLDAETKAHKILGLTTAQTWHLYDKKFYKKAVLTSDEEKVLEMIKKKANNIKVAVYTRRDDIISFQIEASVNRLKEANNPAEFWEALRPLALHTLAAIDLKTGENRSLEDIARDLTTKESAIYNAALGIVSNAGKELQYWFADWLPLVPTSELGLKLFFGIWLAGLAVVAVHDTGKAIYARLSDDEKFLLEAVKGLSDFTIRLRDLIKDPQEKLAIDQFKTSITNLIGTKPTLEKAGIFKKQDELIPEKLDKNSFLAKLNSKIYVLEKSKARTLFNKAAVLVFYIKESYLRIFEPGQDEGWIIVSND